MTGNSDGPLAIRMADWQLANRALQFTIGTLESSIVDPNRQSPIDESVNLQSATICNQQSSTRRTDATERRKGREEQADVRKDQEVCEGARPQREDRQTDCRRDGEQAPVFGEAQSRGEEEQRRKEEIGSWLVLAHGWLSSAV